jgi:Domain of unknown function (DUF4276)
MTRVNIIVEGQTEETFVRDVLAESLSQQNIHLTARSVETSRDKRANKIYRGGLLNYTRARKDILGWLSQDKNAFVSTMFDLYALPQDFPGYQDALRLPDPHDKAEYLQQAIHDDIASQRFIPYIQLHEFEALLFTDINIFCSMCNLGNNEHKQLQSIRDNFKTPEHINDNPQTAPSKRIVSIYPSYEKIIDGVRITKAIGLATLREHCLHFNTWLEKLEALKG